MGQLLKLVQVGTDVFLGFLEGSSLQHAMDTELDSVGSEVRTVDAAEYLIQKELGTLRAINVGSVDTVSFRDLTADELHTIEEMNFKFTRAKQTAMSKVVVAEFRHLLGK